MGVVLEALFKQRFIYSRVKFKKIKNVLNLIIGPYPCGKYPDLDVARHLVDKKLGRGELILADGGYRDGGELFKLLLGLIPGIKQ